MAMKRALITGITGQDGSYLAELLLDKGYDVHGIDLPAGKGAAPDRLWRIAGVVDRLQLHEISINDSEAVRRVVEAAQPDECYHLAAQSFVGIAPHDESSTLGTNILGTHHLISAVRDIRPSCRFFFASSAEMFGISQEVPQTEGTPFAPRSVYGVSKVAGYHLVHQYRERHGLFGSCGILFNHESPRRGAQFVTRKISSAVASISLGLASEVRLGNLDAQRDWGYAPEYVDAMWRMMQQEKPGDYIIATGVTHSVREFCEVAFGHVGLDYRKYVVVDPQFIRQGEIAVLRGDSGKARRELGWKSVRPFARIVQEMVDEEIRRFGEDGKRGKA